MPSFLDSVIAASNGAIGGIPRKGPIGSDNIIPSSPTIAPAPATMAPQPGMPPAMGYGNTSTRLMDQADAADKIKKMVSPGAVPESKVPVPIGSEDLLHRVLKSSQSPSAPVVPAAAPLAAPTFDVLPDAKAAQAVDIPQTQLPSAEAGPAQAQVTMGDTAPQVKGIDWAKVGDIAKSTGKSVLGVLQAAIAGRVAGLQGRAFDPSKDTLLGQEATRAQELAAQQAGMKTQAQLNAEAMRAGKSQDLENQQTLLAQQAGVTEHLKALDQDFQARQDAIRQDFDAKQTAAAQDFQKSRDEKAYQQQLKLAADERDQQLKALQIQRNTALDTERMRLGMPTGGPASVMSDPANLRTFFQGTGK